MIIRCLYFLIFFKLFVLINAQDLRDADFKYLCSNNSIIGASPQATNYYNIKANCQTSNLSQKLDFYLIKIKSGSTFTFTLTPDKSIDYDFVSWLNPNLENVGYGDRGSSNNPHRSLIFSIGLDLSKNDVCDNSGANSDGKVRYYDVVPGDVILIALDRWEDIDSGYTIEFGGDAVLDCSFNGNEYYECEENGSARFDISYYKNKLLEKYPSTYSVLIYENNEDAVNVNRNTYNQQLLILNHVNHTKSLFFLIRDENNIPLKIEEFTFRIIEKLEFQAENLVVCDYLSYNSIKLTDAIPKNIFSNQNFRFKFFKTLDDAEKNINEINDADKYTGGFGEIYIRSENKLSENCFTIQNFKIVNQLNTIKTLIDLTFCDNQLNPLMINLTDVILYNTMLKNKKVKYFATDNDLINNQNEIINPEKFVAKDFDGKIFMKVEDKHCPDFYEFSYHINALSKIEIDKEVSICNNSEYILDLSKYSETIKILGNHSILNRNIFRISDSGSYVLEVTNSYGCTANYEFNLKFYHIPEVTFIQITNDKLVFKTSSENPEVMYSLDKVNWTNKKELTISRKGDKYIIYSKFRDCIYPLHEFKTYNINNILTPNNDSFNDVWEININDNQLDYEVSIFNRLGKKIKEIKAPNHIIWDGKLNGKILPSDSYWYTFKINNKLKNNDIEMMYNDFILLKN